MAANGNDGGFSTRYSTIIQTVTVVGIFVGGFWGAVITPLATRLEKTIDRNEHEEFKQHVMQDITILSLSITKLQDNMVPRGEHIERWRSNDTQIAAMQRNIDDLRRDFGTSYTVADKLKELQHQIELLEHMPGGINGPPAYTPQSYSPFLFTQPPQSPAPAPSRP